MTAAVALASCLHCGLAVPAGRASPFCCAGCEVVHGAIAAHGLDQFYALRETAEPARTTEHNYAELDDPAFQRLHVEAASGGKARVALYLEDLRCTACVWLVESAPRCLPGVTDVRVDLGRSRADVVWDPAATSNLVAGALAVTGLIHPLIAAAVMPLSSLTVLVSSLRSRAFRARAAESSP